MTRTTAPLALLALSALLSACGTTPAPNNATLTLQGTTTGVAYPDSVIYLASGDETNLSSPGTLDKTGHFKLVATAPAAASAFDLLTVPAGCTVSGAAQAHPLVHFYDHLSVNTTSGDPLGSIDQVITAGNTLPFSKVAHMYSDRAAVLRATVKCGSTTTVNYDLALIRGWNTLEYAVGSDSVSMKNLGKVTTDFETQPNQPYISVILAPSTLKFTSNTTFEVAATFYQEGGLGGTYPLMVDVEGLTVEPSTVTLSGIAVLGTRPGGALAGHLNLRRQALQTTLKFTYSGAVNGTRPFILTVNDDYGQQVGRGDGVLDVQRP